MDAFTCVTCNARFGHGGALSTHMRTHGVKRSINSGGSVEPRKSARRSPAETEKFHEEAKADRESAVEADEHEAGCEGAEHGGEAGEGEAGCEGAEHGGEGGKNEADCEDVNGPDDTSGNMFDQTSRGARDKARRGPPERSFRECLLDSMPEIEVAIFEWSLKHGIADSAVSDLHRLLHWIAQTLSICAW